MLNAILANNSNINISQQPAGNINYLVSLIGTSTYISNRPGDFARFNLNLVNQVTQRGSEAIEPLIRLINNSYDERVLSEAALIAQHLAQQKVPGYEKLYAPLAKHSMHPSPTVQVMLAGAMRDIGEPSAAGPLSRMLYKNFHYPPNYYSFDPTEEIAGTLIELIAQRSAVNTLKSLEPRLQNIEYKLNIQV